LKIFFIQNKNIKILDDFWKKFFYFEIKKCWNFGRIWKKKFFNIGGFFFNTNVSTKCCFFKML